MSFADGLDSGINLSLKISALQLQKEEEARLREKAKYDAMTAQSTMQKNILESQKILEETEELRYKNTDAYRRRQEAVLESNMNWRDTVSESIRVDTEEGKRIAERNQDVENWNVTTELLASANRWALDPVLIEQRKSNSPEWQAWQNNTLKVLSKLHDDGSDIVEAINPRYLQAITKISEVLEPNGSELNLDNTDLSQYSSDITTIFRPKLGTYLGKQYKDDKGNEGEIIDIRLTGGFPAVDEGTKAIIETEYTIQTPSGEKKKITGFLPDRSASVIRGDIEQSDAVAVSVADLIDQTAVGKTLAGMMLDNPGVIEVMQEINGINSAKYFPPDQKFEALILETAEELRDQSNIDIEDKKIKNNVSRFSRLPFNSNDTADMETVDRGLRSLSQSFDGFGNYLGQKTVDGKTYLTLPEGETIDGIINKTKLSVQDSLNIARSSTRIPSGAGSTRLQRKNIYDFSIGTNKLEISRGESSAEFLPKLKTQYGDDVIDNAIQDIRNELSQTYSGDVMDNDFALLSELYYYLGSRRRR